MGSKQFQCDQCKKAYYSSENLKVHKFDHTGERPFQCQQCVKTFKTKGQVKKHQAFHAGKKWRSFVYPREAKGEALQLGGAEGRAAGVGEEGSLRESQGGVSGAEGSQAEVTGGSLRGSLELIGAARGAAEGALEG